MTFSRIPDRMLGYATYELAELLAKLTQRQREAIDRIVDHVYVNNRPWAILFRTQPPIDISDEHPLGRAAIPPICAEANYYRRGRVDAEGNLHGEGWGHNAAFKAALEKAAELALATVERERSQRLQAAKRRAEDNAELAVDQWVDVMQHGRVEFARIEAATKVIELAYRGEGGGAQSSGRAMEHDWWAAADGGSDG